MSKYSKEERSKHLQEQQESGMSIKDYCEKEGINPATFHYWLKRERILQSEKSGFTELAHTEKISGSSRCIEISYPSGAIIKIPIG